MFDNFTPDRVLTQYSHQPEVRVMSARFNMLVTAAVLGGLVIIFGSIYLYLYCTKMKKPKR